MSDKRIEEIVAAMRTDPAAVKLLKGREAPKTLEETVEAYVAVAKELGYDLTVEELAAYIFEQDAARRARTDELAEGVRRLDDSDVAEVAGGRNKDKKPCKDTYLDEENCWFNDACDVTTNSYPGYKCRRIHNDPKFKCPPQYISCENGNLHP